MTKVPLNDTLSSKCIPNARASTSRPPRAVRSEASGSAVRWTGVQRRQSLRRMPRGCALACIPSGNAARASPSEPAARPVGWPGVSFATPDAAAEGRPWQSPPGLRSLSGSTAREAPKVPLRPRYAPSAGAQRGRRGLSLRGHDRQPCGLPTMAPPAYAPGPRNPTALRATGFQGPGCAHRNVRPLFPRPPAAPPDVGLAG